VTIDVRGREREKGGEEERGKRERERERESHFQLQYKLLTNVVIVQGKPLNMLMNLKRMK